MQRQPSLCRYPQCFVSFTLNSRFFFLCDPALFGFQFSKLRRRLRIIVNVHITSSWQERFRN
jgi:hypothetical protein